MTKSKLYPKIESEDEVVGEPAPIYENPMQQSAFTNREYTQDEIDLNRAITGEELMIRLRPRIKSLFSE